MSKYHNVRTAGYASKQEARRAGELQLLQRAGKITNLEQQVQWQIIPEQEGESAVHYRADFTYFEIQPPAPDEHNPLSRGTWVFIVEDVKGVRTKEYLIKRKLMLLVHKIRIRETGQQKAAKRRPKRRELQTQSKSGRTSSQ